MSKLEEGKALFEQDKFNEALQLFNEYLNEHENHADALFFRGLCNRKLGHFQESVNDLTSVINKLPEEATLYSERGVSYFHLKDYKSSLVDMNKSVDLEPDNPYRYSSRAYIKAYTDVDGAIKDYEKATQLDPQDEIAYNNLGLLLERRGKMKEAQEKFKRSNKLMGYDPLKRTEKKEPEIKPIPMVNKEEDTMGAVMLNVFRDKKTRKEYFNFLKSFFKKKS